MMGQNREGILSAPQKRPMALGVKSVLPNPEGVNSASPNPEGTYSAPPNSRREGSASPDPKGTDSASYDPRRASACRGKATQWKEDRIWEATQMARGKHEERSPYANLEDRSVVPDRD